LKKEGSFFDISIAVGILQSIGEISNVSLEDTIFIGELSLDGKINPVNGVLPMCIEALKFGIKRVIVPKGNSKEAAVVKNLEVIGVSSLQELIDYLNNKTKIEREVVDIDKIFENHVLQKMDFSEVKGQEGVKRALEIAVAGRHNCLLSRLSWLSVKQ
jgi:magnesium chelatase family protein